jgi:hypothetical protein
MLVFLPVFRSLFMLRESIFSLSYWLEVPSTEIKKILSVCPWILKWVWIWVRKLAKSILWFLLFLGSASHTYAQEHRRIDFWHHLQVLPHKLVSLISNLSSTNCSCGGKADLRRHWPYFRCCPLLPYYAVQSYLAHPLSSLWFRQQSTQCGAENKNPQQPHQACGREDPIKSWLQASSWEEAMIQGGRGWDP